MRRLLLIWCLLASMAVLAVETILVGTVYDAATGEVMPNVSVYFKGTKVGTTTNDEGFFYLHVDMQVKAKLIFSSIGYRKQQYEIEPGQSAGIEVLLEERVDQLATIVAMPGNNPAIALMDRVRQSRRENDSHSTVSMETGINRYYISDIQARHLKRRLWKSMEGGMLLQEDSTYLLPLPDKGYASYMIPLPDYLDFYESNIPLLGTTFLSPLSAGANSFYHFYLMDSVVVRMGDTREKHYRIHFLPKNSFNPTLTGVLEVDSTSAALREVRASMPREANVNYLTQMQYVGSYDADNRLNASSIDLLLEMAVKSDTSHVFPSLLATRRWTASSPLATDTLQAADSAMTAYLTRVQPTLSAAIDDSLAKALQDSLATQPLFRFARWLGEVVYTGYIPTGTAVDIGQISEIIRYTPQEKLHMGLPFRTNAKLWKHVSLGGYVGYGLRDRAVKYKAQVQVLLPTEERHLLSLTCSDRYASSEMSAMDLRKNENSWEQSTMRFTDWALHGVYYNQQTAFCSAARRREVQLMAEDTWRRAAGSLPSVETTLSIQLGHQSYGDPLRYHYYDMPSYRYASLRGMLRLGWGERMADFYMHRYYVHSSYPTLYLGAELGSYTLGDESVGAMPMGRSAYRIYGLLNVMLRQDVALGMGGTLSYLFEAGMVLGKVPYPLLSIMNGNQGYTYSPERFTLMNEYQYAADKYLQLHLNWDGRGILFNQIPGVRYARLHELVEMKLAYGGLSDKHREVIPFPETAGARMLRSLRVPYVEMGVGLGNILRVADVYSVWRLTNRSDPSAARWAVRFRIHLGM